MNDILGFEFKNKVIVLKKNQIKLAGEVIGRAFQNDPIWIYVFPDASKRERYLKYVFQFIVRYGYRYGEVYATSDKLEGIIAWLPPNEIHRSIIKQIRCMSPSFLFRIGKTMIKKYIPIDNYNDLAHKRHAPFPHWYLQIIGVEPIHQKKGFGSILINTMIERLDIEKLPIYLDTNTEYNVNFYKSLGFRVLEESLIPNIEIKQWCMLKD